MGTPAYMAPEQAEAADAVDPRCDLFSLGCVLYEYATGVQPFTGGSAFAVLVATALRDPRPLHLVNPAMPAELSALVMSLLGKKPADRPPSASAVVEALQAIAAKLGPFPPTPPPPPAAPPPPMALRVPGLPTPPAGTASPTNTALEPAPAPARRRRRLAGVLGAAGVLGLAAVLAVWLLWFRGAKP